MIQFQTPSEMAQSFWIWDKLTSRLNKVQTAGKPFAKRHLHANYYFYYTLCQLEAAMYYSDGLLARSALGTHNMV